MNIILVVLKWFSIGCLTSGILFSFIILIGGKFNRMVKYKVLPLIILSSWVGVLISLLVFFNLIKSEVRLQRIKMKK